MAHISINILLYNGPLLWACTCALTLSPPISLKLYTLPYWSKSPFLIFDI